MGEANPTQVCPIPYHEFTTPASALPLECPPAGLHGGEETVRHPSSDLQQHHTSPIVVTTLSDVGGAEFANLNTEKYWKQQLTTYA